MSAGTMKKKGQAKEVKGNVDSGRRKGHRQRQDEGIWPR